MTSIESIITQWKSVPKLPEVRETISATEPYEDWSGCRSEARARRRAKLGFPQRMVVRRKPAIYQIGDTIFMHPEIGRRLRAQMTQRIETTVANVLFGIRWSPA